MDAFEVLEATSRLQRGDGAASSGAEEKELVANNLPRSHDKESTETPAVRGCLDLEAVSAATGSRAGK